MKKRSPWFEKKKRSLYVNTNWEECLKTFALGNRIEVGWKFKKSSLWFEEKNSTHIERKCLKQANSAAGSGNCTDRRKLNFLFVFPAIPPIIFENPTNFLWNFYPLSLKISPIFFENPTHHLWKSLPFSLKKNPPIFFGNHPNFLWKSSILHL